MRALAFLIGPVAAAREAHGISLIQSGYVVAPRKVPNFLQVSEVVAPNMSIGLDAPGGETVTDAAGVGWNATPRARPGWLESALIRIGTGIGSGPGQPTAEARLKSSEELLRKPYWSRMRAARAPMTWHAWVVLAVMLTCLTLLFLELFPPYVVLLCGLCLVWSMDIISTRDAIRGFSNDALITVGALFIVVKGVDRAKVIDRAACQCLGEDSSERMALFRFCTLVFVFGGVMNNTPLVALLMPVIRDWCRERGFAPSKFLMPLAYASMGGGQMSVVGSSTNLMVAGMLEEESGESFTFFDPARVGALVNIIAMGYLLLVGVRMLPEGGGLFKTLKDNKDDMVTQLQVLSSCPLVGSDLHEAMEQLLIPRDAVLKIFRQPPRRKLTKFVEEPNAVRTESSPDFWSGKRTSPKSSFHEGDSERLARLWGVSPSRKRASTEWLQTRSHSPGTSQVPSVDFGSAGEEPELLPVGHESVREIFPVPEFETIEAGDVLVLSLPQEKCMSLTASDHVAKLFESLIASTADAKASSKQEQEREMLEAARSLRICNLDILDVPGRENEFVELVVSQQNPFLGESFTSGGARHRFEETYQVAVLAVRQARRGGIRAMVKKQDAPDVEVDQLTSMGNRRGSRLMEVMHAQGRARGMTWGGEGVSPKPWPRAISEGCADELEHSMGSRRSVGEPQQEKRDEPEPEPERQLLMPGDTVLVLAKSGEAMEKLKLSEEFLVVTQVAHDFEVPRKISDHLPGALFLVALVLVALGVLPMVKVALVLAAVYMVFGWVDPTKLRENVDWSMLALIGCSLGLATAVQSSGLSSNAAQLLQKASFGVTGTVFFLFLFTMMISELVTNNAAAALGFPLAVDLSTQLGLRSVKPLAMVVILASNVSFMNPVSSAATLMTMGPGGYRFSDFLKIGVGMDLIYWVGCSLLVPVMWDMDQYAVPVTAE